MIGFFIQSLIVYTLFGIGMYVFSQIGSHKYTRLDEEPKVSFLAIFLCVSLFSLVSGVRWGVGRDYYSYLYTYEAAQNYGFMLKEHKGEYLWDTITLFMAKQQLHYSFYFGLWGLLECLFVSLAFRKKKLVYPYVALFCALGSQYFSMMNGIRQAVVCCMFIWAATFIAQKRLLPFILWLMVAVTIHKSAIIVAPLYIFAYMQSPWENKRLLLAILFICVVLGYFPIINRFVDYASDILSFMNYDSYANRTEIFFDESKYKDSAWGPLRLSKFVVWVYIIYLYPKVSSYFKDNYLDLSFKLFFIGICANSLVINTRSLFLRPFWYFSFFILPMTAFTLAYLYKCGKKKHYLYVALLILALIPHYWAVYKGYRDPALRDSIFQFFFDPNKEYLRPN